MPQERLSAALADRYRIERELGAGGMATVYLAHDLKHERDVAIKVLHPVLGAALGGERFLSEIRTTARLQHPHILPLLDSGAADGLLYYVMPLVTGETLRARLERERQLPIADAVRIAREVASALDYAHRQGVIHRDIKPENILLHDGQAIVADFGIALAVQSAGGARMTQTGLSLGTPQYMSPEQAMGERTIDARSDIYALGAVTYEMLAGDAPFTGGSVQAIVAKVLNEKPTSLRTLRDTVPAHVEQAVFAALAKLPADRFESARAFADALGSAAFSPHGHAAGSEGSAERTPTRTRAWNGVTIALGTLAAALAITTAVLWRERGVTGVAVAAQVVRFPLIAADSLRLLSVMTTPFSVSSDGRIIVFQAVGPDGRSSLWVRTLDDPRPRRLEGTENGGNVAISPDGMSVAFVDGNTIIRRMRLAGGAPTTVTTVEGTTASLAWLTVDTILYETMRGGAGISRISANGGTATPLIPVDSAAGEISQRRPFVLRRQRLVLFASSDSSGVALVSYSLADGRRTRLGIGGIQALGLVDDRFVYARTDGTLMSVTVDPGTMRVLGSPQELDERVHAWGGGTNVMFSEGGTLVYRPAVAPTPRPLMLVDTGGHARPLGTFAQAFGKPRFSPNGQQIIVVGNTGLDEATARPRTDLFLITRSSGEATRLTNTGAAGQAEWMPDGKRIMWIVETPRGGQLWGLRLDGSGEPKRLSDPEENFLHATMASDGRWLMGLTRDRGGVRRLGRFSFDGDSAVRQSSTRAPGSFASQARLSPDGRLVLVEDFGQMYLSAVDGTSAIEVVSEGAGDSPTWGPDSRRIYYATGTGWMVAEVQLTPTLSVVRRRRVGTSTMATASFDLSPDGRTFVAVQSNTRDEVSVVVGWADELRRRWRRRDE